MTGKEFFAVIMDENLKNQIVERIIAQKPYKAFLFGSYAHGRPMEGSDIDLLVVLDKEGIPVSYKERSENYLGISRLLRDINKKIPMDLIVMTKTQWQHFVRIRSGFAREILSNGIEII